VLIVVAALVTGFVGGIAGSFLNACSTNCRVCSSGTPEELGACSVTCINKYNVIEKVTGFMYFWTCIAVVVLIVFVFRYSETTCMINMRQRKRVTAYKDSIEKWFKRNYDVKADITTLSKFPTVTKHPWYAYIPIILLLVVMMIGVQMCIISFRPDNILTFSAPVYAILLLLETLFFVIYLSIFMLIQSIWDHQYQSKIHLHMLVFNAIVKRDKLTVDKNIIRGESNMDTCIHYKVWKNGADNKPEMVCSLIVKNSDASDIDLI
jgi:hypothetical protein